MRQSIFKYIRNHPQYSFLWLIISLVVTYYAYRRFPLLQTWYQNLKWILSFDACEEGEEFLQDKRAITKQPEKRPSSSNQHDYSRKSNDVAAKILNNDDSDKSSDIIVETKRSGTVNTAHEDSDSSQCSTITDEPSSEKPSLLKKFNTESVGTFSKNGILSRGIPQLSTLESDSQESSNEAASDTLSPLLRDDTPQTRFVEECETSSKESITGSDDSRNMNSTNRSPQVSPSITQTTSRVDQVKKCSICHHSKSIDEYSKNQWKRPESSRTCKQCLEKN